MSTKKELEEKNKKLKDIIAGLNGKIEDLTSNLSSVATEGEGKDIAVGLGVKDDGQIYVFTLEFDPNTDYAKVVESKGYGTSLLVAENGMRKIIGDKMVLPLMRGVKK